MLPEQWNSSVQVVRDVSEVEDMINSSTYADSWKWLLLDCEELQKLIDQRRIVMSVDNGKPPAIGILNRSSDFPQVLQIGYINGTNAGIVDILRYAQNTAHELNCERIQVFVQEKIPIEAKFLDN